MQVKGSGHKNVISQSLHEKIWVKENSPGTVFTSKMFISQYFHIKVLPLNSMSKKQKRIVVFGRKMTEPGIVAPPDAILSSVLPQQ